MVFSSMSAGVMELVDELDSKSCERTLVSVRVRPPANHFSKKKNPALSRFFFAYYSLIDKNAYF